MCKAVKMCKREGKGGVKTKSEVFTQTSMYQDKCSSESDDEENILDVSDPVANRVTTSTDVRRQTISDDE